MRMVYLRADLEGVAEEAVQQGPTLVHISAQLKRLLCVRGCS